MKKGKKTVFLTKPDLVKNRESRYLLIWGDIPAWIVGDKEMNSFFQACDGHTDTAELFRKFGIAKRGQKLLLRKFAESGLLKRSNGDKTEENTKIENIAVNLTQACNLRCRFCYNLPSLSSRTDNELSADEIIEFIKTAENHAVKDMSLALLGGEPLLVKDKLFSVIDYANKRNMSILVSTNGILIDNEFAKKANKKKMDIQVSLDGPDAESNDQIRGKGSFEKIIKGIKCLVEHKVYTVLSLVCHKENIDLLEKFYELAVLLKVNEARFIPLKMLGGASEGAFKPVPLNKLIKKAFDLFAGSKEYQELSGRDAFTITANMCRVSSKRFTCGTGIQTLLLDADGNLFPCLNTNKGCFRIGNIRDNDFNFEKVWNNSPFLNDYRKRTCIDNTDRACSACVFRYWCLGGCQGENYQVNKDFKSTPVHCAENKKSILDMFWVLSENPKWIKSFSSIC
jgi:radical SAM protein with 4Fe4S-binding SPASM domain